MAEKRITDLIKRWKTAEANKSSFNEHWDDLARVMSPRRLGFSSTTVDGERRTDDIFDGTPMQAARGLANAIGGLLRPDGSAVARIVAEDAGLNDIDEAQFWLQDSRERLQAAFDNPKARYRQATGETDHDLVVFGTAVMFLGESQNRNNLLFQSVHLKDATPLFGDEGQAIGLFRKRTYKLYQLIERFGLKNISEELRKDADDKLDQKVDVLHIVLPRENGRIDALLSKNLPMMEMWLEIDSKHVLLEGGYHEFPFMVPRWDTASGEDFGRSPGMIALPDSDTAQAMGETILIAGQRAADPPLAAPNDGSFSSVNTFPGGLTYYDLDTAQAVRGNPFFPLESGMNLPITRDMQRDTRDQIFAAFFRNVLNLPIEGPQMTATEINARKEEFIREIGPVFGRQETDYTAPMVERGFNIMLRNGGFLPIPEVLQGKDVKFEYESPVKKIRQQIEASAAKMWAAEIIDLSKAKPEAIDLVNADELGRFTAKASGIPESIVNGVDTVAQIRAERQQAMQEQAEAEQGQQLMDTVEQGVNIGQAIGEVA